MADDVREPSLAHARTLAQFALRSISIDTLPDLMDALVDVAMVALAADSVHIGRIDRPRGCLRMLRNAGELADWEVECPVDEAYLIADYPQLMATAEQCRAWRGNVDDAEDTAHIDRAFLARRGKAHALSVPVMSPGEVWGEVFVTRFPSRPFSEADQDVALIIAGLAAAALIRIVGDQRLRELAYADPLTGLGNRRAADEQLEAWASDAICAGNLTVILCDVNGLKTVNDTHGHVVGDRLIREVATHVSAAAGRLPQGFAARLGGDEYLIASPCQDQELVRDVLAELSEAAARLPYGGGLSSGSAWAGELIRPEPSPQSLVRSLLRIADSEQYRNKLARRAATIPLHPDPAPPPPSDRRISRARRGAGVTPAPPVLGGPADGTRPDTTATTDLPAPPAENASVEQRLAHAAHSISERAGAVAWWISLVDAEAGTLRTVSCGITRAEHMTDGLWPAVEIDPTVYQLSDFPTTVQALRGDAFHVDTLTGDAEERRLLIQLGFQALIAAGGTDDQARGWLVEIYGDSLTNDLQGFLAELNEATGQAING